MKEVIDISDDMNCCDLYEKISDISPKLLEETLIGIVNNTIQPQKQCDDCVCIANKLSKEETKIDWTKPAEEIHNLVRGICRFPSAYFTHNDKIIKVIKTRVVNKTLKCGEMIKTKEGIEVGCGENCLLLLTVKPEGKGEMSAKDWSNGIRL